MPGNYHAHAFVDGAYFRKHATDHDLRWIDPTALATQVATQGTVRRWGSTTEIRTGIALTRTIYYDAWPEPPATPEDDLREYWEAIERRDDTHLGFGSLKAKSGRNPRRQKKVDTLLSVDLLVGAYTNLFSVALLLAGDSDFVPVVEEVRRKGVMIVVAGMRDSLSDELRRVADRVVELEVPGYFPPMEVNGRMWPAVRAGA